MGILGLARIRQSTRFGIDLPLPDLRRRFCGTHFGPPLVCKDLPTRREQTGQVITPTAMDGWRSDERQYDPTGDPGRDYALF
jgi:hypothetical protein